MKPPPAKNKQAGVLAPDSPHFRPAKMQTNPARDKIRKAGNSLAKYLDGQKEAPAGPTERN